MTNSFEAAPPLVLGAILDVRTINTNTILLHLLSNTIFSSSLGTTSPCDVLIRSNTLYYYYNCLLILHLALVLTKPRPMMY